MNIYHVNWQHFKGEMVVEDPQNMKDVLPDDMSSVVVDAAESD